MMDNLHIVQWNAARSTAATNYLLSTLINNPKPPQAILIQEPPWYQIGLEPSKVHWRAPGGSLRRSQASPTT